MVQPSVVGHCYFQPFRFFDQLLAFVVVCGLLKSVQGEFTLTVLHTNDVHARFDPFTALGATCNGDGTSNTSAKSTERCYGGVARRVTAIEGARRRYGPNVILLDAGDEFQGTVWFRVYHGKAASYFMNKLHYDAMALGNHEFDNGISGLVPFLRNATFPVLCCNLNASAEPSMDGLHRGSTTLEVGGQKVAIIGYLTAETPQLSNTGHLVFEDEVKAIQREVNGLRQQGIKKIIALGHAGFDVDKKIAAEVEGLALVVGGHTNTFLYNGTPPAEEVPQSHYPEVIVQRKTGRRVPVVQAFCFGKYLGIIHLTFNDNSEVIGWSGNPQLLDSSVEQDNETLEELTAWRAPVAYLFQQVVGVTLSPLGPIFPTCRLRECKLGNLMGDAMVDFYQQQTDSPHQDLQIAILNGGSIRASIGEGNISFANVMETFPFGIAIDIIELSGRDLLEVFEFAVSGYDPCRRRGKFLQVSGVRVTYDMSKPNGRRVNAINLRKGGDVYTPLNPEVVYKVAVSSYMIRGGDNFTMVPRLMKNHHNLGNVDTDIVIAYLKRHSPVNVPIEGRITIIPQQATICSNSQSTAPSRTPKHRLLFLSALFGALLIAKGGITDNM